ncbi:MAG: hypothetical protein A4E53_00289 [Pelotomaculum sp. PtaB.Bin104]|nr:MAG: hypothetical protein A4E53_00289 [Pelotomaculum sp. PtaB.Bin104]
MSGDNILSNCRNLRQCEEKLKEWIRPNELLGRIPLGTGDWLRLGKAIKKTMEQQGPREGTKLLWANFPVCMAVFLVFTGIRHYQAGEFWPAMEENAGVPVSATWEWGAHFLDFLRRNELPVFDDIKGLRYITPILGHGGIPNYCLEDFFKFVLTPAIEMGGVTAEEILDDLSHGSGLRYHVDKPIQRFLLKGGKYALDFFERTLEMARRAVCEEVVPRSDELGLPDRITRAYDLWLKQAHEKNKKVKRDVLHSPVIFMDPYGLGVAALLPAQQLETVLMGVSWDIKAGEKVLRVRCKAWRVGDCVRSSLEQVPLPPAENYHICLIIDGQEYREWTFRALQPDRPYLAFAINSGQLVRGDILPAKGVWLILRDGWDVVCDEFVASDEIPPLGISWRNYKCIALYTESARTVKLQGHGDNVLSLSMAGQATRPALTGGNLLRADGPGELTYSGRLPSLCIPCGYADGRASLEMWRLFISKENAKDKAVLVSAPLSELAKYMDNDGYNWLLPLDAPGVLGTKALGVYNLSVRGPLGSDALFKINCVYGMDVSVPAVNLWPAGKTGYRPVNVIVAVPSNISINFKNCTLVNKKEKGDKSYYEVVLESDFIIYELDDCALARPLAIRQNLRPLSWGWLGLKDIYSLVWENKCRTLGASAWRDSEDLQLILNSNWDGNVYHIQLTLRNLKGQILQTSIGQLSEHRRLRFSIGQFKDTISATSWPGYELWLTVRDEKEVLSEFQVALLDREWRASNVQVMPDSLSGNVSSCIVFWEENDHVANRIVRVWSLWRPWEEPYTATVPDNTTNLRLDFPQLLGPGIYRFEISYQEKEDLFINHTARPLLPNAADNNVCDLKVNTTEWHYYAKTLPHTPLGNLERFLIHGGYDYESVSLSSGENERCQYKTKDFNALFLAGLMLCNEQNDSKLKGLARYLRCSGMPDNYPQGVKELLSLFQECVVIPPEVLVVSGWCSLNYGDLDRDTTTGCQLEDLWQNWPLAALLLEQVFYNNSKDSAVSTGTIVYGLSFQGLERLLGRTDVIPYKWPDGSICQYSLTECLYRLLRYECICNEVLPQIPVEIMGDSQGIKMVCLKSAEELEDMFNLLNIEPRGLLHPDYYIWSLFRWLIDIKSSQREEYVNAWVQENLGRADKILRNLSTEEYEANPLIIDSLAGRYIDPKGSLALVNFPYISGVVALAQRKWAREPGACAYELELVDLAVDICRIYPGLYCRDLCLFEILLSILL